MNKFTITHKWIMAAIIGITALGACKKSENPANDPTVEKPYIITMAYAPPSGFDYSYFTVPFEDLMTGALNAQGQGAEQVGYFDYTKINETIYAIGGLDDVKVTALQQEPNSSLKEVGNATFTKAISDLVEADESNLLGVSVDRTANVISFYQIAKNTVTVVKSVSNPVSDITSATDVGLEFTGLAVVGDKVFLSYYYIDPNTFATPQTDQAEVAVYSYPELEFQKVITDSRVGAIGGFNVKDGLIKDENGNVYAISTSNPANGYSQTSKPAGVLKIAKGTSTFDPGYFWEMTDGEILTHAKYMSDGNAFAKINTTARVDQGAWTDGSLKAAVVNFNSKAINYISGIPAHDGSGRRLAVLIDGQSAYLPVNDGTDIYIYKADLKAYTATKGAQAQSSFVAGIFKY
jgi:hypothetical protein